MSKLNRLAESDGPQIMYDPMMRQVIEDHLQVIINDVGTTVETIPPEIAHSCRGDFYAVLSKMGTPPHMRWVILRTNGYTSPTQYTDDRFTVLVPSSALIDTIVNTHRVNQTIAQNRNN